MTSFRKTQRWHEKQVRHDYKVPPSNRYVNREEGNIVRRSQLDKDVPFTLVYGVGTVMRVQEMLFVACVAIHPLVLAVGNAEVRPYDCVSD